MQQVFILIGTSTQKEAGSFRVVTWLVVTELSQPTRPERVRTGKVCKNLEAETWVQAPKRNSNLVDGHERPKVTSQAGSKEEPHPDLTFLLPADLLLVPPMDQPSQSRQPGREGGGDSRGTDKASNPVSLP